MRPLVFRPTSGIMLTIVVWVIAALILISLLFVGDGPGAELWPIAPAVAAAAWLTWVAFWWPCVRIAGEGIEVRNPLRTVQVPWSEADDISSRRGLVITTSAGPVTAWAAPPQTSGSQRRAEFVARARVWRTGGALTTPDEAKRRTEPDVAEIIRRVQSGRTQVPTTGPVYGSVAKSWNFLVIVVSLVLVAGAVGALI